jgi:hypothetical protein
MAQFHFLGIMNKGPKVVKRFVGVSLQLVVQEFENICCHDDKASRIGQ